MLSGVPVEQRALGSETEPFFLEINNTNEPQMANRFRTCLVVLTTTAGYSLLNAGLASFLAPRLPSHLSGVARQVVVNKALSAINALLSTCGSIYVCFVESREDEDSMGPSSWLGIQLAMELGYYLYDTPALLMPAHRRGYTKPQSWVPYLLHHGLMLAGVAGALIWRDVTGPYDRVTASLFLSSASTPLLHLSTILDMMGRRSTTLARSVRWALAVLFFVFRVLLIPVALRWYSLKKGVPPLELHLHLPLKCMGGCLLWFAINVFWFSRLCKGLVTSPPAKR